MRPESASPDRLQHAQGDKSAHILVSNDSTWSGSAANGSGRSVEAPHPLGLRRWTRCILEFVPLGLVLAAGWFSYGCGVSSKSCGPSTITGPTTVAVGVQVQLALTVPCDSSAGTPTWSASPSGYLSVDNNGNVTGVSATPAGVTVTVTGDVPSIGGSQGYSATATLTVTGPTLQSIAITDIDNGVAAVGEGDFFTATGTYSDQSTQNLTNSVAWTSSVPTVAKIATAPSSGPGGDPGDTGTPAPGETLITASLTIGSATPLTSSKILTVGTLQSIAVTEQDNGTVSTGAADQFTATGTYAGGATQNITTFVTWSSGTPAVATILPSIGVATGVTAGQSLITASLTPGTGTLVTGTEMLTVVGPTLVSIAVTPVTASIPAGAGTVAYTATGTFSDSSQKVLSGATWASSNTNVATISSGGVAGGLIAGTSTITATVGTVVSPGVTLTVTAPVLQSIVLAPASASVGVFQTQAYTVTGHYSNQTSAPITSGVTFSANPIPVATINSSGIATGLSPGSATISAAVGTLTSNPATLTVTAATSVSRYLLVLSNNGVAVDSIVPGTGQLRASNVLNIPNIAEAIDYGIGLVVNPYVQTVYVVDQPELGREFIQYSLSPNGALTYVASLSNDNWTGTPVVDPLGRFIFVGDNVLDVIWTIPLDSSGNLGTPVAGATGVANPGIMAVDPTATYLFMYPQGGSNVISYQISGSGTLTPIGSPVSATTEITSLAVAPSGKVLYALAQNREIYAYNISGGVLTPLTNLPFSIGSSGEPQQFVIDPSGSFLYVTEQSNDGLFGFTIGANGELTQMQPGTSFPVGQAPNSINVDAGGNFVYVNNQTSADIWVYAIGSGTGLLTNVSEIRTQGHTAQAIVSGTEGLTFTPTALFVANTTTGQVNSYAISPSTGNLSSLIQPTAPGLPGPTALAADPFGAYLYETVGSPSNEAFLYNIGPAPNGLSPNLNVEPTGNGATSLTTDLSDSFLYVTNQTDGTIWEYNDLSGGNFYPVRSEPPGGGGVFKTAANPSFVVTEPTGQYIYEANNSAASASIGMYKINLPGGSLSPVGSGSVSAGNSETWIAVDPSGRYAYSADPDDNVVWEYTINPSGVLALNTPSSVPTGSTFDPGAYSVVVEPSGQYLYASNYDLNEIYAFSIKPSTGVLTQVTGSLPDGGVANTGNSPTALVVDISGQYLYCVNVNAGTAGAGSIGIYSINLSNGFLTAVGTVNVTYPGGITTIGIVQ